MANLTSPSITVTFIEAAAQSIQRGDRGIVALALKDTTQAVYEVMDVADIPTTELTAANVAFIKDALKGYTNVPRKIIVYVMQEDTDMSAAYTAMMEYFETEKFDWMAVPPAAEDEKVADIASWVKAKRADDYMIKAVLPKSASDSDGIINWATTLYKDVSGTKTAVTPAEGCARIAGLLAGTGLTVAATYAPLTDYVDADRITKAQMDTAVGAGKLIAFWDGEKVKLNRAVTSFVTTTDTKGDSFKKIRIVEAMDMMKDDIRKTIQDSYIGKFTNSYDNKCLLITAINSYFQELVNEGVLASGSCEINLTAQKNYLAGKGKDVSSMSDQEIKEANTDSHVFLQAVVSILDAIEDVDLEINI